MLLQISSLSVLVRGHRRLEMGEAAAYNSNWLQLGWGLVLDGIIVGGD